jgi:hypothetical protein
MGLNMKKLIPILIVGVLFISGLGAVATPNKDVEQTIFSFSNISLEETDGYATLDLDGANSVLMDKNHYMIPIKIETFTYPFGTTINSVQCTPKNIQTKILNKRLEVAPDPIIISQPELNNKVEKNVAPISKDIWYEYDVGTGIDSNQRYVFVKVTTYPVQYHPTQNSIEWAKDIQIDIDYKLPEKTISFDDEYNFIILAPAEFSDELGDLVTHKISRGISTIFVSTNDIYDSVYFPVQGSDNQEKIKYFIKNAIENWGTSNVLLVGSSMKFPVRITHVFIEEDDDELFVSDLYYADIYNDTGGFSSWDTNGNEIYGEYKWNGKTDEVDFYPDVYLGRLACTSGSQVTTVVNKIIDYETNEAYKQEWFTNLVVAGGDTWTPDYGDDSGTDEGEYVNEKVIDIMSGFVPEKLWATNGKLGKVVPPYGKGEIDNAINEGCGFVDFSGHGNPQVWSTHPHNSSQFVWLPTPSGYYTNSHVSGLTNGNKLPIVIIGACSTGKFNSDSSCFGWSWVSNSNGGAIATICSAALGYAYLGKYIIQGLIEGLALDTFRAYSTGGALTFGEMWSKAITRYVNTHSMRDSHVKSVEEWQPFGDPTLAIGEESQAPVTPAAPNGPTSGEINVEHTYTASTTDPDGDRISYLFDWGNGDFSGWIGPYNSGSTASAKYTWKEEGNYEIRVKAKDEHGVQSDWSPALQITMPKNHIYYSILLEILERLMERFPLLEQILSNRPIISSLLGL